MLTGTGTGEGATHVPERLEPHGRITENSVTIRQRRPSAVARARPFARLPLRLPAYARYRSGKLGREP